MRNEVLIWVAIGSLLSLGLLFWCFFCLRRKRLIENVPTSKVKRDYFAAHGFERAVPNTET